MNRQDILKTISFGDRVAETEATELSKYFVETEDWRRVIAGDVDIVFGPKGAGKSALYSLLIDREKELHDRSIAFLPAENPRGTPAFRELATDPPAGEAEFRSMWKLYFLSLVAQFMRSNKVTGSEGIVKHLESAELIPESASKAELLKGVVDFVKRMIRPQSLEAGLKLDPLTGLPAAPYGKITFDTLSAKQKSQGVVSVDSLLTQCDELLAQSKKTIWLGLDRLDVAFDENVELETNALRALFRVYNDFQSLQSIRLKVFLRSDIWNRITSGGFREASHITRTHKIQWTPDTLLNLVIRRILKNEPIISAYNVDVSKVLQDIGRQYELFYQIFPKQVHVGKKQSDTFDWLMTRTRDGTGLSAPREVIHFLNAAKDKQLESLSLGRDTPESDNLFARPVLKASLTPVSETRLTSTIYAENPDLKPYIEKLRSGKATHSLDSLTKLWKESEEKANELSKKLVEIGLFEARGVKSSPTYWIPFLYRDALELTQGSADED